MGNRSSDDLSRPDVLAKLLEAKRTIHTLALFERDTNVFDRIDRLAHEADQRRVPLPSGCLAADSDSPRAWAARSRRRAWTVALATRMAPPPRDAS